MALKPWYKVAIPRENLREGKPLDTAEFAVHLDDMRNNCAPPVYRKPKRVPQSMILFAASRGEALKRLLVEEDAGHGARL